MTKYAILLIALIFMTGCTSNYRSTTSWEDHFWYGYNQCEENPYSIDCIRLREKLKKE